MALDWRELVHVYVELGKESTTDTFLPAWALREKARQGELPEEAIPLIVACLALAADHVTITHLAKALAVFGRRAGLASSLIIEKLRGMHVDDDTSFWSLDGCLHALGHLGGEVVGEFLDELAARSPNPVTRAGSVYQGEIPAADREKLFSETLTRVRGLLAQPEIEGWRSKRTKRQPKRVDARKKMSPWMTRK